MNTHLETKLGFSLAGLRLVTGVFFLVWALEKILAPELATRVSETFYGVTPTTEALFAVGLLQVALIIAFVLGLFKKWTYGSLFVIHTLSVLTTIPRLIDPYTAPNTLFWAGVPIIALLAALYVLRDHDTVLTYRSLRKTAPA